MYKKKAIKYSLEIAIGIIIIVVLFIINDNITQRNAKKDLEGYHYNFDYFVYDEKGEIIINGWCIKEGVSCDSSEVRPNFKVFLAENGDLDKLLEIPVKSYVRQDVAEKFNDDVNDYTYCGFSGSVKVDSIIKDKKYRILIQYDSTKEKFFFTNKYLNKGIPTTEFEQFD